MTLPATIAALGRAIRKRELSPAEVIEAHLSRIAALEPRLGAFAHVDAAGARAQARAATEHMAANAAPGPLFGVPLSIKSSIDVAGWPCPAGSLSKKDYVPAEDAPLVARLRESGAILVGNTSTPEFLMAYETDNLLSGPARNPWNFEYSAGGSSGGEAAAISSGATIAGIGSDAGGSIRVPAHFCGLCGLKPTPGRIPSTGHLPPGGGAFSWLGVVGPMARTVADLQTLFAVLSGPDAGDALAAPVLPDPGALQPVRSMRIGIVESEAFRAVTPETAMAVRKAVQLLAYQGAILEPLRMENLARVLELWWFFFGPVIARTLSRELGPGRSEVSAILGDYLSVALREDPTLDSFLAAAIERDQLRARIIRQMQVSTMLLSPVSCGPAFRLGAGTWQSPHGYRETMRHSQWVNLVGFPAVVVPMLVTSEGLPIGVQLIGRPYEDERILEVAARLEEARGPLPGPPRISCA